MAGSVRRSISRHAALVERALGLGARSIVFTCFFVAVHSLPAQDTSEALEVYRTPLRIEVHSGSTPETARVSQVIAISEAIADIFKDSPVVFDVAEHIDEAKLVDELTGDILRLGVNERSPIVVKQPVHKIFKDQPGELIVAVSDPKSLQPGVYRGQLWTIAYNDEELIGRKLKLIWDIDVVVHGRRLIDGEFERVRRGDALRVGAPASIILDIETIGCDLGQGFLKLDWLSGPQNHRALYVALPTEKPMDPLVDFQGGTDEGCHAQWRDFGIWSVVRAKSSPSLDDATNGDRQRYEVLVAVPPCFLPGRMEAEVSWEQASVAPSPEPLRKHIASQPVLPGILVYPQMAFVNEPIAVVARTPQDLGSTLRLAVSGQFGRQTIELPRQVHSGSGEPTFEYNTRYLPKSPGIFQVEVPRDKGRDSRTVELGEPVVFRAGLGVSSAIPTRIEVFAGIPPAWMFWSTGWKIAIRPACGFWYMPEYLKSARLETTGVFRGSAAGKLEAHKPQSDPLVKFDLHIPAAPKVEAFVSAEASRKAHPAEKKTNKATAWALSGDGRDPLLLDLMIDLNRQAPAGDPRHRVGGHAFVQRMLLHTEDVHGDESHRIVQVPLQLQVSTAWLYYRWLIGIIIAIVVLSLALLAMCRWARGSKAPSYVDDLEEDDGSDIHHGAISQGADYSESDDNPYG